MEQRLIQENIMENTVQSREKGIYENIYSWDWICWISYWTSIG